MHFKTRLIHHRGSVCEHTGAVSPPIYQVSTFKQQGVNVHKGFEYSRGENPTRQVLENYVSDLEGGSRGFAFASGMAAISACFMLLKAGDHIVATEGLYGGTYRVLSRIFERFNLTYTYVDTNDLEAVQAAFSDNTRMLYLETPSNPLMSITDIARMSEFAHSRKALVAVDNTFMSPYLQRPLLLGADISLHSASKFLGGHSDLIAGVVATKDKDVATRMKWVQVSVGGILGPQDSWLLIRGMKTLGVRMAFSQESAQTIATWLCGRPEVEQVYYPGLPAHPRAD
ncbi:MAG: methionine biosynthesis PLP-dependent protein, partial [Acidobacteria bacterium]